MFSWEIVRNSENYVTKILPDYQICFVDTQRKQLFLIPIDRNENGINSKFFSIKNFKIWFFEAASKFVTLNYCLIGFRDCYFVEVRFLVNFICKIIHNFLGSHWSQFHTKVIEIIYLDILSESNGQKKQNEGHREACRDRSTLYNSNSRDS